MKKLLWGVIALAVLVSAAPVFAQKTYRVGVIPKFIAEDYFIACERGFRQAEKELGNIKVDWIGDTMSQTSAANQKNYIQSFIDKKYDAILVSALDPESYADTLRAAMKKGIKVITWDADVNVTARNFFVNQAEGDQIAVQLLKGLAGGLSTYTASKKATVALVSTTNDSPNQNAWLKAIISEYNSKKTANYKHINLMADPGQIVYAGNDRGTADEKIKSLLSANKNIKGIIALSSNTVPAVSSARDQLGIKDSINIVGVSVPESSRKDMVDGKMAAVVLWQPFDLGYLTLYVASAVLQGKNPTGAAFTSPLSGKNMTVSFLDGKAPVLYPASGHKILSDNVIILGDPIVWNLKNIDRFRGYPQADSGMAWFNK
jgi:ABC-type sugar transport system substrate-binding protein